ncbi:MAG TPA: HAMP domain-containing sensor histidine kinase [Candidatus Limnocylindrales bacterium]|nr:HAMP domain-containing sensor histidine kinase [Candidatus Limnocylindrales bacterium]
MPSADPPTADRRPSRLRRVARRLRRLAPRTFQARLTLGFAGVVTLTLVLVSGLVLNRLDNYFEGQQAADLEERTQTVAEYTISASEQRASIRPVVYPQGVVNPAVLAFVDSGPQREILADRLGQADVRIVFGLLVDGRFEPATNGVVDAPLQAEPRRGQSREPTTVTYELRVLDAVVPYAVQVTLANPYTFRASAIANLTGLLIAIGLFALALSVIVAAGLARRFTTPLRRLTDASRALAEGDLGSRVPLEHFRAGASELTALALQFNAMAERLEESVTIIRRDRDRSRDFLADVSHELRTPIAAMRTFNELLKGAAGDDPVARTEFLESSGQQLERLDWLAQNLLELSKLDSGLVLLDLRREDLRSSVEQAVDQASATARRRGVELTMDRPTEAIPIRHDPVRIGQVVTNLVGNAIKFTPRGGRVDVRLRAEPGGDASIIVADTGIGIDPTEMPRVFDRFFRGSRANEARGSGSGLGLAIVRSIVEMHGGSVAVESRLGAGSTFRVVLPARPRPHSETESGRVAETSSSPVQNLNPEPAP